MMGFASDSAQQALSLSKFQNIQQSAAQSFAIDRCAHPLCPTWCSTAEHAWACSELVTQHRVSHKWVRRLRLPSELQDVKLRALSKEQWKKRMSRNNATVFVLAIRDHLHLWELWVWLFFHLSSACLQSYYRITWFCALHLFWTFNQKIQFHISSENSLFVTVQLVRALKWFDLVNFGALNYLLFCTIQTLFRSS